VSRLLPRFRELRDFVLQRLRLATEAVDFLVRTFATHGSRRYWRQYRGLQLQAQPSIGGRPSQGEHADDTRTKRHSDEGPKPQSGLASLSALNRTGSCPNSSSNASSLGISAASYLPGITNFALGLLSFAPRLAAANASREINVALGRRSTAGPRVTIERTAPSAPAIVAAVHAMMRPEDRHLKPLARVSGQTVSKHRDFSSAC